MSRPLRIEFAGALIPCHRAWQLPRGHLRGRCRPPTARRPRRCRRTFQLVVPRLPPDDQPLPPDGRDAGRKSRQGLRQLNGVYTQTLHRRHRRSGHLFQGRYNADPGRRRRALDGGVAPCGAQPGSRRDGRRARTLAWRYWSSYRATPARPWRRPGSLPMPAARPVRRRCRRGGSRTTAASSPRGRTRTPSGRSSIARSSRRRPVRRPCAGTARRGSARTTAQTTRTSTSPGRSYARRPRPWTPSQSRYPDRRRRHRRQAHATGAYSHQQIADAFGLHFTTVCRIVRAARKAAMLR